MVSECSEVRLYAGKQFTLQSIKSSGKTSNSLIKGRTLFNQAQVVLKNWKKALAYGAEFLLPDGSASARALMSRATTTMFSQTCMLISRP